MAGFAEYEQYDALGMAELVQRKEVHPSDLLEAAIERIERRNPVLNAVNLKLYDRARQAAKQPGSGPLWGVPYLIKDMVPHAGTPLTYCSALLRKVKFIPQESHKVVDRSERAGLVVLGKTNGCEFGLLPTTEPLTFGPTENPWRPGRSPGGSSGGSAAAVAAGMVPMAHANDGGGSIRIPASACGVFGLKPSRGRNPGSVEEMPVGIITEHCVSRSVRDSAALLDITRGPLPGDRYWAPGRQAHADCATAVRSAAALLEQLGHQVEETAPDIDGESFNTAFIAIWTMLPSYGFKRVAMEARKESRVVNMAARLLGERSLEKALGRLVGGFEPLTREMTRLSAHLTPADMWMATEALHKASYSMGRFLQRYDILLTPVLGTPPVKTGQINGRNRALPLRDPVLAYAGYTPICNTSGLPAMSMPLHWNDEGMPIGVHFIGRFADEATLFRVAGQLERAQPWWDRRPLTP